MKFDEKPHDLPTTQWNGEPLKALTDVITDRRATNHFANGAHIPEKYLQAILRAGLQAPSGYNLQPWRFIIVREAAAKKHLQEAAFNQPKISEAPIVLIAVGMKDETKLRATDIFKEGARRGVGSADKVEASAKSAIDFISKLPMDLWVNRQVMIAVTTMMLVAESFGFDTAPMEGFDEAAIKKEFAIPEDGRVVALLAMGRREGTDKGYPGRLAQESVVFEEKFGVTERK